MDVARPGSVNFPSLLSRSNHGFADNSESITRMDPATSHDDMQLQIRLVHTLLLAFQELRKSPQLDIPLLHFLHVNKLR